MPKSAPQPLKLDEGEREQLQQLVNRHQTPQQLALRASIILLADEGRNHQEIARELGRLLEEATLKPHQSGDWLNPPRPSR